MISQEILSSLGFKQRWRQKDKMYKLHIQNTNFHVFYSLVGSIPVSRCPCQSSPLSLPYTFLSTLHFPIKNEQVFFHYFSNLIKIKSLKYSQTKTLSVFPSLDFLREIGISMFSKFTVNTLALAVRNMYCNSLNISTDLNRHVLHSPINRLTTAFQPVNRYIPMI